MKRVASSVATGVLALTFAAVAASPGRAAGAPAPKGDKAIESIDRQIQGIKIDKSDPSWKTKLLKQDVVAFEKDHSYFIRMQTNKGAVRIKLMPDVAPMHVTSFIYLTRLGFFDGLSFHRVMTGFMAQGGCPLGTGTGNPGYRFDGEFAPNVKHDRPGLLSMANAGPGTDGSQFFLTFVPTPWLDNKHTIFGEVVDGKETLKALEAAGSKQGKTSEPLAMEKVVVEVE